MKIIIEGTEKEIADFVLRIQNQPSVNFDEATKTVVNNFTKAFEANCDTDEEFHA